MVSRGVIGTERVAPEYTASYDTRRSIFPVSESEATLSRCGDIDEGCVRGANRTEDRAEAGGGGNAGGGSAIRGVAVAGASCGIRRVAGVLGRGNECPSCDTRGERPPASQPGTRVGVKICSGCAAPAIVGSALPPTALALYSMAASACGLSCDSRRERSCDARWTRVHVASSSRMTGLAARARSMASFAVFGGSISAGASEAVGIQDTTLLSGRG